MNEVRNRGEELAKCLKEVHKKKFIHGDFKLKNVVLDAKSDKWKLIDFDSSVNYQEATELRGKISTAFAPPELVTKGMRPTLRLRQGPHAPNEPDVNVRKDWKPLAPHPSYDVWSFGAVLFHLIMGEPLFNGQDHLGNLDENGLNELGNWSRRREERLRELGAVDLTAKRLLEQVLDPNWKRRPSMEKILDHDFFHPERLVTKINELRMEKQRLEEELDTSRNDSVFIEEVQKKLDNINRQLHGLESTMTHRLDSIESQVVKIALQVSSLRSLLVEHQIKTTNMLTHLLENTKVFPRFVIMIPKPTENESKWWKLAIKWTKPGNWVNKEVQIYFVCPITLTRPPDTEGYSTTLRRDWVVKYGPALLVTLRVLQVACAVGRLTGLPLPNIQDVKDMTADLISDHAGALSTMYNSLREELGDVGDLLESKVDDYVHIPSAPSDIGGLSAAENAVQRSYGEIMEIAKQAGDPELEKLEERCGLVRAYKSDKSTSAYVRKDAAQLYARLGDKAFHLSEEDLKKELNVIIV
jgi:serine/threonine protein kinase